MKKNSDNGWDGERAPANFTEETINVSDLDIDRSVQRSTMDTKKVERFVRNYNAGALGVVTVSRRKDRSNIILDGQHRVEVVRRITDGAGSVLCHVFTGLTRQQEAQHFLDLNAGNQPHLLDKFKVRVTGGDPDAVAITEMVQAYGWTISFSAGSAVLQCVGALERIYKRSLIMEADPNLLQLTIMSITRSWGNDRQGGQAVILEGVAALYAEHGSLIDTSRLITAMEKWPGGALGLHTDASAMAAIRKGAVHMAVAELLTEAYNSGRKTKTLPAWRRRR